MKFIDNFKAEKKYRKLHRIAYWIFLLGCALVSASLIAASQLGDGSPLSKALSYASIACVIVFFLMNFLFWRCPGCNRNLPIFGPIVACQYCKREFFKDGKQVW